MATLTTDPHGRLAKAQIEVLLVLDDDSGQYVAYCPALEVSSYGDTEEEARAAFEDALAIFIKDTAERGTLDQFLLALGWRLLKQPEPVYEPPRLPIELLNRTSRSRRILTEEVLLPA
ncbi:type II toxin-antitoxin system HicB family antitoxin [Hymenobacter sp. DH14]|uniref:Type II toxin-antitoxin system HicB family antitoxin n=1 Tax=Hymenobacter cyanobacteriorum TaxID=2926463 RepID=A0A9X1VGA3_9BACT|nr:type II toxin-antitoxin system HicB family antitoxin [Hymenobacter cyanobacteriorum]MCI1188070.1 type II toxin-antitoxin system HicB family antitoxin [Hymenobacter cyanobacteriorum]